MKRYCLAVLMLVCLVAMACSAQAAEPRLVASADMRFLLDGQGTLWAWGGNGYMFGAGNDVDFAVEPYPFMRDVQDIAYNRSIGLTLGRDGDVCMLARYPKLGSDGELTYIQAMEPVAWLSGARAVSAGWGIMLAILEDDTLVAWGGEASSGVTLGNGQAVSEQPVTIMSGVETVFPGDAMFVLKKDGSLWGWGSNRFGMIPGQGESVAAPVEILRGVTRAYNNGTEAYALTADHTLYAWGSYWESANGTQEPTAVFRDIADFGCGVHELALLDTSGRVYLYDRFRQGCRQIEGLERIVSIQLWNDCIFALDDGGQLWSCFEPMAYIAGDVWTGQGRIDKMLPAAPAVILTDVAAYDAEAGCAVRGDGTLWSWAPLRLDSNHTDEREYDGLPRQLPLSDVR